MEQLIAYLETVNATLMGAPAAVVCYLGAIAFGYVLKVIPVVDNRWIPGANLLLTLLAFAGLNWRAGAGVPFWTRSLIVGVVIWALAWLTHAKFLKAFEDRIPLLGKLIADASPNPNQNPNPNPNP